MTGLFSLFPSFSRPFPSHQHDWWSSWCVWDTYGAIFTSGREHRGLKLSTVCSLLLLSAPGGGPLSVSYPIAPQCNWIDNVGASALSLLTSLRISLWCEAAWRCWPIARCWSKIWRYALRGRGEQDPPCLSVGVSQILYSTAGFWAVWIHPSKKKPPKYCFMTHSGSFSELIVCLHFGDAWWIRQKVHTFQKLWDNKMVTFYAMYIWVPDLYPGFFSLKSFF